MVERIAPSGPRPSGGEDARAPAQWSALPARLVAKWLEPAAPVPVPTPGGEASAAHTMQAHLLQEMGTDLLTPMEPRVYLQELMAFVQTMRTELAPSMAGTPEFDLALKVMTEEAIVASRILTSAASPGVP